MKTYVVELVHPDGRVSTHYSVRIVSAARARKLRQRGDYVYRAMGLHLWYCPKAYAPAMTVIDDTNRARLHYAPETSPAYASCPGK